MFWVWGLSWHGLCCALGLWLFSGCGWVCGWDWGWFSLDCFFSPPSLFVSPLSLLLFRFVAVSMSSGCSSGGCCFYFFFFNDVGVWITATTAISVVTAVVSANVVSFVGVDVVAFASAIVTVVVVVAVDDLTGDFLFLPSLQVTWVHPSFLFGIVLLLFCFFFLLLLL